MDSVRWIRKDHDDLVELVDKLIEKMHELDASIYDLELNL